MGATASKAVAVAAVVAALAGTAACGGGDAEGKAANAKGPATHSARPVVDARTLTQAELENAEIGAAELPGWTTEAVIGKGGHAPVVQDPATMPQATPGTCQPLYAMSDGLLGGREPFTGVAAEYVKAEAEDQGLHDVLVNLRSYPTAAEADRVVTDLRTSLTACPGEFGSPRETHEKYGAVRQLPDPAAGDDALAYRVAKTLRGTDFDDPGNPSRGLSHIVVVRCGATVASFAEVMPADVGTPEVPAKVVTAQAAKLAKAGAGH
jgi:hypothetical protein